MTRKQSGQRCVCVFCLVLDLFYSLQWSLIVLLQRILYFSKDPEGFQHFPGASNFFHRGSKCYSKISIVTHITCDFTGEGVDLHMLSVHFH